MNNNLIISVKIYHYLKDRLINPEGTFDKGGRWYPQVMHSCCRSIRAPSRAFPYSYMTHCRTAIHVANDFKVDVVELLKLYKEVKNAYESFEVKVCEFVTLKVRYNPHLQICNLEGDTTLIHNLGLQNNKIYADENYIDKIKGININDPKVASVIAITYPDLFLKTYPNLVTVEYDDEAIAHKIARIYTLPNDFNHWGLTNEQGETVAQVAKNYNKLPSDFDKWILLIN